MTATAMTAKPKRAHHHRPREKLEPIEAGEKLFLDGQFVQLAGDGSVCLSTDSVVNLQKAVNGKLLLARSAARRESAIRLMNVAVYRAECVIRGMKAADTRYLVALTLRDATHYADIVTGTIFDKDRQCVSSPRLYLVEDPVLCTKAEASKYLRNLRKYEAVE